MEESEENKQAARRAKRIIYVLMAVFIAGPVLAYIAILLLD